MNIEYSKAFVKKAKKIAGKELNSLRSVIKDVQKASSVTELSNCKKLVGYKNSYRIRIGDIRLFFTLMVYIDKNDTVIFQYLLNRGEAYSKKYLSNMRKK